MQPTGIKLYQLLCSTQRQDGHYVADHRHNVTDELDPPLGVSWVVFVHCHGGACVVQLCLPGIGAEWSICLLVLEVCCVYVGALYLW